MVIGLPPSNGATNDTVSSAFPAATVGCAGGSGTRLGITTTEAGDAYTFSELDRMFHNAGFSSSELHAIGPFPASVILSHR